MAGSTLAPERFCIRCGSPRPQSAPCPQCEPAAVTPPWTIPATNSPSARTRAIALCVAAVMTAGIVVTALRVNGLHHDVTKAQRAATAAHRDAAQLRTRLKNDENTASNLNTRLQAVEAVTAKQQESDPARVANRVEKSVFTVDAGDSLGSSFVVASSEGGSTLLTNFHVVSDVWLNGDRNVRIRQKDLTYDGEITDVSQADDLALISVDTTLPVLRVATHKPSVGDAVLDVGSPLGLERTVSTGIVSAFRTIGGVYYLQFSAAISPGNSGGPVVNSVGDVIGVAEMKIVGDSAENLSFAIPSDIVCTDFSFC